MYFIQRGDCIVNLTFDNKEHIAHRLLIEGNHFGEIGILFNCARTCSVISRNFVTLSRLEYDHFREVCNKYPKYKKYLIKRIYQYDDPKITFYKKLIKQVKYF